MDGMKNAVERFILDPANKDALTLVKAIRNGIVYGAKVRFPHALVMVFLFRSGSLREKLSLVFKATRQHATNLATFAFIYKLSMLFLRYTRANLGPRALTNRTGKTSIKRHESSIDTFLAGAVGGYYVFGRKRAGHSSVNQQIVIYVFARVMLGLAKLALQPSAPRAASLQAGYGDVQRGGVGLLDSTFFAGENGEWRRKVIARNTWPVFASLSWAAVMWLFRWHPDVVQPSLRSSMKYIYENADNWDGLQNFLWHNT